MKSEKDITFEIGGRYRNRIGWYEVLDIIGTDLRIRYEDDHKEATVSIKTQQKIIFNISQDEMKVTPHDDTELNKRYFMTLGYLTNNGFIEAIVPPKSKHGFDNNFLFHIVLHHF